MTNPMIIIRVNPCSSVVKMVCLFLLLAVPATAQVDFDRWLDALAQVETANRPAVRGAAGELSAWQITAPVWRVYTRAPFAEAQTNPRLARLVARTHAQYLAHKLTQQGRPVTPAALARRWNPRAPRDYAIRIERLYQTILTTDEHQ